MFKNRNLSIISLVAVVNALGYGIVIPVLYSYSQKYGLSDFQNGLLFALFSLGQFISTPIIGRFSDKYGRKPLLIGSIAGTAVSFFMMAFAPNAIFLFIARALDGLTAGNIPVATAVIADTTKPHERIKAFGIIGASFGFGFVVGPAISGFTVGISLAMPFIIAGIIASLAVLITAVFLPETNPHIGQIEHKRLFDFGRMWQMLKSRSVGLTFIITLLWAFAFGMFIYAFQPYAVKGLNLSPRNISIIFTAFGAVGLIMQMFFIGKLTKWLGDLAFLKVVLVGLTLAFLSLFLSDSLVSYVAASMFLALANAPIMPLVQGILSKEADPKEQGEMQGLNASYMSIGMTVGPIVAGTLVVFGLTYPFLAGSLLSLIAFFLSFKILLNQTVISA